MKYILPVILCYFAGAIPFSYILVKLLKGIDIRSVGSGNAGATNVGRILGKWGFVAAFSLDMLKGYIPLIILKTFFNYSMNELLVFGICIIIGHTFTVFLNFKGGKGVATAVGVYLVISPLSLLMALWLFLTALYVFKMVSLSSIIAAITLMSVIWLTESSKYIQLLTTLLAIFVIVKHKENIKRIIKGTEKKIGERVD